MWYWCGDLVMMKNWKIKLEINRYLGKKIGRCWEVWLASGGKN
jgi:hypothetical protein